MTNPYYNVSGSPVAQSRGTSGVIRSEYTGIAAGFDKLPTVIQLAGNAATLGTDSGSVNAFIITGNAAVTSLVDGIEIKFKALNNATGASTLNFNMLGALPLQNPDGSALAGTSIVAGQYVTAVYSSTRNAWQVLSGNTVGATGLTAWASPGAIGSTTPNSGAFTTLSASGLASFNGLVNIGNATPLAGQVQLGLLISTDTGAGQTLILRKSVTTAQSPSVTFAKSRGTAASPTIVAASDFTMAFSAFAYDGATYGLSAQLASSIDGTPGAGSLPSKWTFATAPTGSVVPVIRLTIDARGQSIFTGGVATSLVSTGAATYTVLDSDSTIIFTAACTVTLPAAASYAGRKLYINVESAAAVISNASNVIPQVGGAAGTAILAATAGKWATLQSNGTNWKILQSN